MDWRFVLSLLFALIVAIFAILNSGSVEVNFLFTKINISQALIILGSAVLGAVTVMLLNLVRWVRMNSKLKQSTKAIAKLEEENNRLKIEIESLPGKNAVADEIVE